MNKESILDAIFADDPDGILTVKPKSSPTQNSESRLRASFEEIISFYSQHNREPEANPKDIGEYKLYMRLQGLRDDLAKAEVLLPFDVYSLLPEPKKIESIDDIFNDPTFDELIEDSEEMALLDTSTLPKIEERQSTDFVATRKPCKNFEDYEALFKSVQEEISQGKREVKPFTSSAIFEHSFYVMGGVLLYVESISTLTETQKFKSGKRDRKDGRTRCIFENGTESKMLYRSMIKQLQKDGRLVTQNKEKIDEEFQEKFSTIGDNDKSTGYIYVLSSRSEVPEIRSLPHLYKIGFSKIDVEKRIQNAAKEATYLMAPVKIEGIWKCFNMNPQKFEGLLHAFFGSSCLDLNVMDAKGKPHSPREWFMIPYSVIQDAIPLIITGKIVHYRYDSELQKIVDR